MKKYTFLLYLILLSLTSFSANENQKSIKEGAHIYGVISGSEGKNIEMVYDGVASIIGKSKNITLKLDPNGRFEAFVPLTKPEYFSILRNTLYLSPGDNLECFITESNEEARYNGKGAESNEYLKDRLFPKGGSFLKAGTQIKETFELTKIEILKQADIRRSQLMGLKNVSKEFRDLENSRINADIIISYYKFPSYAREIFKSKTTEEFKNKKAIFFESLVPEFNSLLKKINEDRYLDVAAVRDALISFNGNNEHKNMLKGITFKPLIQEMFQTIQIKKKLGEKATQQDLNEVKAYIKTMRSQEFKKELEYSLKRATEMKAGIISPDIEMTNSKGEKVMLSDFKGKFIYLDFWATWCGPCKYESPFFEKLAKEFNPNEIVFISLSVDNPKKRWLDYLNENPRELPQYNSVDASLNKVWNIAGIPRFVVIDPNFKIVNPFAPRPSEETTKDYLKQLLIKK